MLKVNQDVSNIHFLRTLIQQQLDGMSYGIQLNDKELVLSARSILLSLLENMRNILEPAAKEPEDNSENLKSKDIK